jgi:hypothetical protein
MNIRSTLIKSLDIILLSALLKSIDKGELSWLGQHHQQQK